MLFFEGGLQVSILIARLGLWFSRSADSIVPVISLEVRPVSLLTYSYCNHVKRQSASDCVCGPEMTRPFKMSGKALIRHSSILKSMLMSDTLELISFRALYCLKTIKHPSFSQVIWIWLNCFSFLILNILLELILEIWLYSGNMLQMFYTEIVAAFRFWCQSFACANFA